MRVSKETGLYPDYLNELGNVPGYINDILENKDDDKEYLSQITEYFKNKFDQNGTKRVKKYEERYPNEDVEEEYKEKVTKLNNYIDELYKVMSGEWTVENLSTRREDLMRAHNLCDEITAVVRKIPPEVIKIDDEEPLSKETETMNEKALREKLQKIYDTLN